MFYSNYFLSPNHTSFNLLCFNLLKFWGSQAERRWLMDTSLSEPERRWKNNFKHQCNYGRILLGQLWKLLFFRNIWKDNISFQDNTIPPIPLSWKRAQGNRIPLIPSKPYSVQSVTKGRMSEIPSITLVLASDQLNTFSRPFSKWNLWILNIGQILPSSFHVFLESREALVAPDLGLLLVTVCCSFRFWLSGRNLKMSPQ